MPRWNWAFLPLLLVCACRPEPKPVPVMLAEPTISPVSEEIAQRFAGTWALYAETNDPKLRSEGLDWTETFMLDPDGTYIQRKWSTRKFSSAPDEATAGTWAFVDDRVVLSPITIGGKTKGKVEAELLSRIGPDGQLLSELMFQEEAYLVVSNGNALLRESAPIDKQLKLLTEKWQFRFRRVDTRVTPRESQD